MGLSAITDAATAITPIHTRPRGPEFAALQSGNLLGRHWLEVDDG
jgi:hypothetical protein